MRNCDWVSEYIQATADLMREGKRDGINSRQSHHSQVIQSNLSQLVTFPLFFPSMKIKQNCKNNPYYCATWKTLCRS